MLLILKKGEEIIKYFSKYNPVRTKDKSFGSQQISKQSILSSFADEEIEAKRGTLHQVTRALSGSARITAQAWSPHSFSFDIYLAPCPHVILKTSSFSRKPSTLSYPYNEML